MRRRTGIAVALALAVVYAVLAPRNRTEAEDAYDYAWSVEHGSGRALLHPHHMAYLPLMQGVYAAARAVAGPVRAHPVMAAVSAGCAGAAVVLLAVLLAGPLGADRRRAWAAAAGLASSYGFWRYAAEAEVYAPVLALALGAWVVAGNARRWTGWVLSGALGGASVLVHVFAAIPAMVAVPLWLGMRRGPRAALIHGGCAAVLAAAVYACAELSPLQDAGASAAGPTDSHTLQGVQRPADGEPARASPPSVRVIGDLPPGDLLRREGGVSSASFVRAGVGFAQSLVSGNFLFAQPRFAGAMRARYPARMLDEEIFMGRAARPWMRVVPWGTLAGLFVAALAWIGAVARGAAMRRRGAEHPKSNIQHPASNSQQATSNIQQPTSNIQQSTMGGQGLEGAGGGTSMAWKAAMVAGAVWFVLHTGLPVWKEPGNPELWIAASPAVWILAAVLGSALAVPARIGTALVVALAVHNWAGGLALLRDPAGDYNAAKAASVLSEARPGDVVLTAGGPVFFRHLRYRCAAEVVDVWADPGRFPASGVGAEAGSARVLVLGDVFAPPTALAVRFPSAARRIEALAPALRGKARKVRDDGFGGVFAVP